MSHHPPRMTLNQFGRLQVEDVRRLHRVLEGDRLTEEAIMRFIADKFGAISLSYLPIHVAEQILQRPADFIRAAKQHCQPELLL